MRKRLLSLFLALVMVLGMLPVSALALSAVELPFAVEVDGEPATVNADGNTLVCDNCGEADKMTIDVTGKEELTFTFGGDHPDWSSVILLSPDADWDGYEEYEDHFPEEDGTVTLTLPADCNYLCVWDDETDASYHFVLVDSSPKFTAFVNGQEITPEEAPAILGKPCYLLTVPVGTTEVDFTFNGEKDYHFYNDQGTFLGTGETASKSEYTIPVQDAYMIGGNGYGTSGSDGVLDGLSIQKAGTFSAEYYIMFAYAASEGGEEESEAPFLNIKIEGEEIAAENILLKCAEFLLGDYDADDPDGPDGWDYVHNVPYYHVTVPCGTPSVDVTYSADTNILDDGTNAYGYKTALEVDAVTSATLYGATFKDAYTKNEDGTQTVKTPVTGYTFDEDGNGYAITLEEDGDNYQAVCLFSFEYDGKNHVYDDGKVTTLPSCETEGVKTFTCSCGVSYTKAVDAIGHDYQDGVCANCGGADPDYVAPGGAVIPNGAPFTALTTDAGDASAFEDMGTVDYNGWSTYEGVPYYHVTIPAGATQVYVTHPFDEDPFCDASYGSAYGYAAETEGWTGSGMTYEFEEAEDGYIITLPLSTMVDTDNDWTPDTEGFFVADEDGYVGYAVAVERNGNDDGDYSPICFFTFQYAEAEEGEHVHAYDEGVVTTQPGCETEGVKTFTCFGCAEGTEGHSYTETVPATGHKWNDGEQTKAPTCNEAGEQTFTCQNDKSHTRTETVSKLGHKYDDGIVDPKPTCTEAGVKTYTCSQCEEGTEGHTKTETVAATGHNYQDGQCLNDGCDVFCPKQDENGVFQIGTYEELLWFAEEVNAGNTTISGALTDNITLPENWPGIGNSTNKFGGSFNGQNHTITLSGSIWGLFAYAMGTWDGNYNVKVPVVIENVITAGTAKNTPLVQRGGYIKIINCANKANVIGTSSYIGGILGNLQYALQYNSVKHSYVLIENCINEGNISGGSNIGGILGEAISGTKLNGCVNTGDISGTSAVGGLVGYFQQYKGTCEIRNSYNTGKVTGTSATGGLVGQLYSGPSIINCYNAGETTYAIAGYVYNKTGKASNTYYRYDLSVYGGPESYGSGGYNTTVHGTAKSSAEMGGAAFAALLGDAFKESCGGPVLTWQEAVEHEYTDGICYACKAGHTEKAKYNVIKSRGDGYEIVGDTLVTEGNDYTFTVEVMDGYDGDAMQVYFNGTTVSADAEGEYTVTPTGHFYITVTGVKELEGVVAVSMPGAGDGYRVVPCEGYGTTVESGKDFKFVVNFVDGFKAGEDFTVQVNGATVKPDADGVYTVENIIKKQTITVDGVDVIPSGNTVMVDVSITDGEKEFLFSEETGKIMLDQQMEISYFDIGLYGLERYYYNPYCYVDENGNIRGQQKGGTRESAYGVVTVMHAYIYLTEVYYLGLDEEHAGTGYSDSIDSDGDGKSDFDEAVSWTQGPGSSFMNLWGKGTNLNYHVNYRYPVAYEGWGSTSDQIALKDGDMITVHLLHQGSGSAFGTFVVNDDNNEFNDEDRRDNATVRQGEKIKLTLYWGDQGDNYTTSFVAGPNKDLYWVEAGDEMADVREWSREDFGAMTAETMVTDENGEVIIDTAGLEAGTYYIAAEGGFTKGTGKPGADGFVSAGAESGPAYFVLTVEEDETQIKVGDVNMDGVVDSRDANLVISYYYGNVELTQEQLGLADVDGIVGVDIRDANLINSHYYGMLEVFPVEG